MANNFKTNLDEMQSPKSPKVDNQNKYTDELIILSDRLGKIAKAINQEFYKGASAAKGRLTLIRRDLFDCQQRIAATIGDM